MTIAIRYIEPGDFEAIHCVFSGPRVVSGVLAVLSLWLRAT
jgi:hypothetical protein